MPSRCKHFIPRKITRISQARHPGDGIITTKQFNEVESLVRDPRLRVLVLGCSVPFLDDSPSDAALKVTIDPACSHLRNHWPHNSSDLLRMLSILFTWLDGAEIGARRVVLLAPSPMHGPFVSTKIKHVVSGTEIEQWLVPSIGAAHTVLPSVPFELEGSIAGRYTYKHSVDVRCAIVTIALRARAAILPQNVITYPAQTLLLMYATSQASFVVVSVESSNHAR